MSADSRAAITESWENFFGGLPLLGLLTGFFIARYPDPNPHPTQAKPPGFSIRFISPNAFPLSFQKGIDPRLTTRSALLSGNGMLWTSPCTGIMRPERPSCSAYFFAIATAGAEMSRE